MITPKLAGQVLSAALGNLPIFEISHCINWICFACRNGVECAGHSPNLQIFRPIDEKILRFE
ncbi:hypothetical protein X961_4866 [Burkholderia pseudomallei MSHR5613]|nr:hypothetical protein DM75_1267 [Burkholderia mallei]KGS44322.1 hypothetical protein X961_4866 [Burkholderia pseudomallei MSHR5613]KGS77623.1 hypothetical protein X947_4811 [Burkholderia pseudomallei MSHR7334]KOS75949.1 hypothetical protein DM46_1868 [Burkholderia mallei]KOT01400.1 hypothetical protein DM50_3053 [Burkholderia mallei]